MNKELIINSSKNYLSEIFDFLPTHVLLNKGMTGCGGTTLELTSKRNSIILVPTINLVENKTKPGILGITGYTKDTDIINYMNSDIPFKKIIGTYDSLKRIIQLDVFDYFLLVDEYHYLFTYYKFRNEAITYVLNNYTSFKNWCFMTATPLSENNILEELKHIDTLSLKWEDKAKLEIKYSPTEYYNKLLNQRIYECLESNYNLHIFLNSFATIKKIVNTYKKLNYRVVCSIHQKDKSSLNFQSVNSPVKKINFYTATAFEGVDIFDPVGKIIVVSDSSIVSTMMDISINIVQIAGRIRDSKWLNEIEYIYSSKKHRYLNKTEDEWKVFTNKNKELGEAIIDVFKKGTPIIKESQLSIFTPETHFSKYVNCKNNELYYDNNLYKFDQDTYQIFVNLSKLYTQKPLIKTEVVEELEVLYKSEIEKVAYSFLIKGHEYTKQELEELFYEKQLITKNKFSNNFIADNFDNYQTRRRVINKTRYTVYIFY